MKQQIKIIKHENKTSKEGKDYTKFQTSNGWCSAFETDLIEDLKKAEGRTVSVEIVESADGKFKNIRKFLGVVAPGLEELETANQETEKLYRETIEVISPGKKIESEEKVSSKSNYNPTSMYVSYAKDIFCAMIQDEPRINAKTIMQESIDLVKQAHKAFE